MYWGPIVFAVAVNVGSTTFIGCIDGFGETGLKSGSIGFMGCGIGTTGMEVTGTGIGLIGIAVTGAGTGLVICGMGLTGCVIVVAVAIVCGAGSEDGTIEFAGGATTGANCICVVV
jgi:hypothetical protein